jgi:glycosyltransferase involved in cell wall biosynthesis
MRILEITAGAAGMYCGSCLRDNALAAELKAMGHDVILLPMYTPTLTDEPNVSDGRVFFGGVSVYLQQNHPIFRHTPALLDKLWDSRLALRAASRRSIPVDPHFLGEMTVSMLEGERGVLRKEFDKLTGWLRSDQPADVVSLPYTLLSGLAGPIRKAISRPVTCTFQGEDLFLEGLVEPYRGRAIGLIKQSLEHMDALIAVSRYCADAMASYLDIPRDRIDVAALGVNTADLRPVKRTRRTPLRIGYLARIAPEKGLHCLCEAYRMLKSGEGIPDCTLEAAGYLPPEHRGYLDRLLAETPGLRYHGALDRDRKVEFLQNLDVFSVPAVYRETKGLSLLEAMACGVPVVQPRQGSFVEMIEATGGGLMVEPDDPAALAGGLARVLGDASLAAELARRGSAGVAAQYPVRRMAERNLEIFRRVAARHGLQV